MRQLLLAIIVVVIATVSAFARLGETQPECRARYGQPITNFTGIAEVTGADVFEKDGIRVSVLYVKQPHGPSRVGVIIYADANSMSPFLLPPKLTEEIETQLLSLVPGKWQGYEAPEGLKGKPKNIVSMSHFPTPLIVSRDAASNAVANVVSGLNPKVLQVTGQQNIGHNGSEHFAFRVRNHLVVCTKQATGPAGKWALAMRAEQEKAKQKPTRDLKDF